MNVSRYYFDIVLSVIGITCLFNMLSLKGIFVYIYPVSKDAADVLYTICSGIFSGFIIYILTNTIPQWKQRNRSIKTIKAELTGYVEFALNKLDGMNIKIGPTPNNQVELEQSKERLRQEYKNRYKYGMAQSERSDSVHSRLLKIKNKNEHLREAMFAHYTELQASCYYDTWTKLKGGKIFSPSLKYIKFDAEQIKNHDVEIGALIAEYYWDLESAKKRLT